MAKTPGAKLPVEYSTVPRCVNRPPSTFGTNCCTNSSTSTFAPCIPGTSGTRPVAFDTAAISTIVFVPSMKDARILGFMSFDSASPWHRSGVIDGSIGLFLHLPRQITSKPISTACSYSILHTPGSSPDATV